MTAWDHVTVKNQNCIETPVLFLILFFNLLIMKSYNERSSEELWLRVGVHPSLASCGSSPVSGFSSFCKSLGASLKLFRL